MRILIVDDSRAIQNIVRRGLEKAGYENLDTKLADNGSEALDIARHWEPDLIITDWHMPEMSGMELLQALNREMLGIKVGFVTTETSGKRLTEAREAGACFIVNKPFEMDTLVNTVLPVLEEEKSVTACDGNLQEHFALANLSDLTQAINQKTIREVFLERTDPIASDNIKLPFILSFYCSQLSDKVRGLCLLDINAINIIGGAVLNTDENEVQQQYRAKQTSSQYKTACDIILQTIGTTFIDKESKELAVLKLSQSNLVKKPFSKLNGLLSSSQERIDLEIAVLGYGQGHMIIVTS